MQKVVNISSAKTKNNCLETGACVLCWIRGKQHVLREQYQPKCKYETLCSQCDFSEVITNSLTKVMAEGQNEVTRFSKAEQQWLNAMIIEALSGILSVRVLDRHHAGWDDGQGNKWYFLSKKCICEAKLYPTCWLLQDSLLFPHLRAHSFFTLHIHSFYCNA